MSVHLVQGENQKKTLAGIGADRVSNFRNLIRVAAYVQKFVKRLRKQPVENSLHTRIARGGNAMARDL